MASLCLLVGVAGCNSAWFQHRAAQRRNMESLAPAELGADRRASTAMRTLRLHAHATPDYRAQVLEWAGHFRDLVDRVNRLTEPGLGIRLEVAATKGWDPQAESDDLDALVEELTRRDPGRDADWVVGLVGPLPRLSRSMEQLGAATLFGKHLVVRASNDAEERDAIDEAFGEMGRAERERLYRRRKRHKEEVLLLHELAHTLGGLHVRERWAILHPTYSQEVTGFAPANAELLRIVLAERSRPEEERDEQALVEELLAYLGDSDGPWIEEERRHFVATLEASLSNGEEGGADGEARPTEIAELLPDHQLAFSRAASLGYSRRAEQAWDLVEPLVAAYPDVYAVHELACHVDTQRGTAESPHCARMRELQEQLDRQSAGEQ